MAINVLEEAQRVEVSCDGCGRVIHVIEVGEFEADNYESPLTKIGNFSYCGLCQENHQARHDAEQNSYAAKHLQLRETIADPEELEQALKDLDEEHGIERTG